jgi:hypothetical protein
MSCDFLPPKGLVITNPLGFVNPITGGRKRPISKPALRIARGAADGQTHNFAFTVLNPSNRLRLIVEAAFESDSGTELTIANITWQLKAYARNPATGRSTPMQLIYGPANAPDGYEVDTAVRELRGTVFVPSTSTFGFAVGDGGFWVVNAIWESDEDMPDAELAQLFSACSLSIDGNPLATTFL